MVSCSGTAKAPIQGAPAPVLGRSSASLPCNHELTEVQQPRARVDRAVQAPRTYPAQPIADIRIAGTRTVPVRLVRAAISARLGSRLTPDVVRADLAAIWRLEVFSDARVLAEPSPRGLRVTYAVAERPLVGRVFLAGDTHVLPWLWRRYRLLRGAVFDPARFHRERKHVVAEYAHAGYLEARVVAKARPGRGGRVDLCFAAHPGKRFTMTGVEFVGNKALSDARLRKLIKTRDGTENVRGGLYRKQRLAHDLLRVQSLYYDHGMINARVGDAKVITDRARGRVSVRVGIDEGKVFRLGSVRFRKARRRDARRFRRLLGVAKGQVFSRTRLVDALTRVRNDARGRKRPVELTPITSIDTTKLVIDLTLEVKYL